jgi:hypothetical protein
MRQKLFSATCVALWGERYQVEAARQLGLGRKSVQRYDLGERDVPQDVMEKLQILLLRKQDQVNRLLTKVSEAVS